jgi:hypothetical protein
LDFLKDFLKDILKDFLKDFLGLLGLLMTFKKDFLNF